MSEVASPFPGTNGKTILITGASGFIASHVVRAFLIAGYHVRGTVRSEAAATRVIRSHVEYADRISFSMVPDLAAAGAFDKAVEGVDGVIHIASPNPKLDGSTNGKFDILDPAINGTTGILQSIKTHNPFIKRVVITSSAAALVDLSKGLRPGYTYTENDWSPLTYEMVAETKDTLTAYMASKPLAEKAAFDFVKNEKPYFDISTILPAITWGPPIQDVPGRDSLGSTVASFYDIMNGSTQDIPPDQFCVFVDVRDIATMHLRAYEDEKAAGQRFLGYSGMFAWQEVCDILRKTFPELKGKVPLGSPGAKLPHMYQGDSSKARMELQMEFRGLEECVVDTAKYLLEMEKYLNKC